MQFTPENCELILAGKKTQTRRPVKPGECFYKRAWFGTPYNWHEACVRGDYDRLKWQVGRDYAICPGRGKKAVGRIRITGIRRERLGDISQHDAMEEGIDTEAAVLLRDEEGTYYSPSDILLEFHILWDRVYGMGAFERDKDKEVWVLEFELVEAHNA